jgi:predicted flap endonuclease-1-like 5' DNA nuclease
MEVVMSLVYVAIGALIGGLLTLAVDNRFLGQRVQAAVTARKKVQGELKLIVKRLAASEATVRQLAAQLQSGRSSAVRPASSRETAMLRTEAVEAELHIMRENLTRMGNQSDELIAEKHELSLRVAESDGKWVALQEQLAKISEEARVLQEKNEHLHHQLGAAEVEIRYLRRDLKLAELDSISGETEPSAEQVPEAAPSQTEVIELGELEAPPLIPAVGLESEARSDVQKIRGIGPVFASRLLESGVHTLADLAEMTPEQLTSVLGMKTTQLAKSSDWIDQARKLATDLSDGESLSAIPGPLPATDPSQND